MKIAAETVLWGDRIENLENILDVIANYGCEGVEFSQPPEQLGSSNELREMLLERDLTLLGLSGGTLRERIEFCGDILKPEYLYVEDWQDSECEAATAAGFKLALHPHLFKPIHRLEDAEKLLETHGELLFLPDVAHLTIAGDAHALIRSLYTWRERLAAIHLKDWTPVYGRSSHRYARGFVELGQGVVNFHMLFERLRLIRYNGWLVFEQGKFASQPEDVLAHAMRWLASREFGVLPKRGGRLRQATRKRQVKVRSRVTPAVYAPEEEKLFFETTFRAATEEMHDCYPLLTEAVSRLLNAKLVLLCACSPAANVMSILGDFPRVQAIRKHFMDYRGSLSSVAVERQAVTSFNLQLKHPGAEFNQPDAQFGYPELVEALGLNRMISVPVLNPQNPHQARFVLNIFPRDGSQSFKDDDLIRVGNRIAQAADAALDERCALGAAKASTRAGLSQTSRSFLEQLRGLILEALRCDAVGIFLVNDSGDRLEEAKSEGLRWVVPLEQRFFRKDEQTDIVSRVWQRGEAILSPNPALIPGIHQKIQVAQANARPSCLCAPMVDVTGAIIGVILCQNKHRAGEPGGLHMFSEDDVAALDAICQSAVPHLQVLLSKERRAKALRRLTHELNNPLVALLGATEALKNELLARFGTSDSFFREDFVGDVESSVGLMRGLLGNANFFRLADKKIVVEQHRVKLYGDVFMPAVKQIRELLIDRDFEASHISVSDFENVPTLWLDKYLMTQVVFNLLSNAIKYADDHAEKFRIEITGRSAAEFYEVDVCDWGSGIAPAMKHAIFEEGVRSKEAEQSYVAGDGLGLWVARRALMAHGGDIQLTGFLNPTKFTIFLPKTLARKRARNSS